MATKGLADSPWLLLSGTLCTNAIFDGFLKALGVKSSQTRSVELKYPSVDDYRLIFEDLAEDTIVCGFSLGAIVAAHNADRMTARRLILFGVNPHADDASKAQSRHDLAADVAALGGAAALRSREIAIFGPTPDTTRNIICDMADASAHMITAQTQLALSRPGALPALGNARMPVLSFTGSLDRSAPPMQGFAAAQAAPDGQFHELAGLGHFALLEDPRACAAGVQHYWKTPDGAA